MPRNALGFMVALGLAVGCGGGGSGGGASEGSTTGDSQGDPSDPGEGSTTSGPAPGTSSSGTAGGSDTDDVEPPPPPTSPKANLQFKGPRRLEADLAGVLELDPEEVCVEVGGTSCTRAVHRVALGGVSPYDLGIYEPPALGATAPIATDRVVLRACQTRIDRDLEDGAPVLFSVPLEGESIADLDRPEVDAFIDALYTRGLLRHAAPTELEALRGLYEAIASSADGRPARSWAVATCFATLTTAEFLFY